ncbi:MAG: nucleoside triphosphate pyrophosphohydrolase family protein [Pseudomonadota bacterium]
MSESFDSMLAAVQAFHDKHRFNETGGEDMVYRLALMTEELGEIAECVTKGRPVEELSEECADLLILLIGNAISANFDLESSFWKKMKMLESRHSKMIDGRIRVSQFDVPDGSGST